MTGTWMQREALIVVKAYPNPSAKYFETVCVAAVTREEGLIRLYPVAFRSLPENQRFKKYQRIELRMQKHERDPPSRELPTRRKLDPAARGHQSEGQVAPTLVMDPSDNRPFDVRA
jgi:hypothetical protein